MQPLATARSTVSFLGYAMCPNNSIKEREKQMSGIKNFKLAPEAPAAIAVAEAAKIAVVSEAPAPAHDALSTTVPAQDAAEDSILTIDFEKLRADNQDYQNSVGVKIITSVLVSKPGKQVFFRVDPDPKWRVQVNILELKGDKTSNFLLAPSIGAELADGPCASNFTRA